MTAPRFDAATWIARLAVALEAVAAIARPSYSPLPPEMMRSGPTDERWAALHRGYRALAARAKHDSTAASQFDESILWLNTDPAEAWEILREHPLMKPGIEGSGTNEGIRFRVLNSELHLNVTSFVSALAKLSVKEGGEEAARRVHRYLSAAATAQVPAHEITVFHGLIVAERVDLGRGAYVAPYKHARAEFDLPDEPEPFPKTSHPNAAVLVRGLRYGPGVASLDDDRGPGLPDVQVAYEFPTEYQIDLERWFYDSRLLVDLLSIAARVPLLTRTRYVRLAPWIGEINPNFAFVRLDSGGNVSDVWPKGRDLSNHDADAFLALSRGWRTYPGKSDAMDLAIRRLAASFSRPGGRFGEEDRILDVAIALEVLYGGTTGRKLSPRAAGLLAASAAEQIRTYDQATRFYGVRSSIVHSKKPAPARGALGGELEAGRDLACRTLACFLNRNAAVQWTDVMRNLRPETQSHIAATRRPDDE